MKELGHVFAFVSMLSALPLRHRLHGLVHLARISFCLKCSSNCRALFVINRFSLFLVVKRSGIERQRDRESSGLERIAVTRWKRTPLRAQWVIEVLWSKFECFGGLVVCAGVAMGRCGAKVHRALQKLQHGLQNFHHHNVHPNSDVRSDDDGIVPSDVPAGFLVVYVGEERRRFVIKAKILKHDTFRVLLEKSAEEFGYRHDGGLIIACDVAFFEHLLELIETKSPTLCQMQLRDYWAFAPDNSTYHMVD